MVWRVLRGFQPSLNSRRSHSTGFPLRRSFILIGSAAFIIYPSSGALIQATVHILRAGPSAAPGTPPETAALHQRTESLMGLHQLLRLLFGNLVKLRCESLKQLQFIVKEAGSGLDRHVGAGACSCKQLL